MPKILEKVERRLGEKLFLKGDRCLSPKCAAVRKPYPPGVHGKKRHRAGSEYSELLKEKQKLRFLYGLDNKVLKKYFTIAKIRKTGGLEGNFVKILESRLDNIVFRLGFAISRSISRQMIGHGHILVNGKVVNIPSYLVRKGDKIEINPSSKDSGLFSDLSIRFKKYEPPAWLSIDKEKITGEVKREINREDVLITPDLSLITEFYSR